ncbi:hypothetical protein BGX28_004903 [Mortierella sp. GBA30]|nr:hypothetical protein BGX28_004903 [Mortierella sp. GBA30]
MRGGFIALLFLLWLLSGDDSPQTGHLQEALLNLREEVNVFENKTFGENMTYPVPEAVSSELTKLFQAESKDLRAHYYHNVTGSFKGAWKIEEDIASSINQEFPLPNAPAEGQEPKNNDTLIEERQRNATQAEAETEPGTKPTPGDDSKGIDLTDALAEDEEAKTPVDTIEDNKPTYVEDVEKLRGSFQFNKSGSFVFNVRETKATEYINWVKGTWRLKHDDNEDYGIALNVQGVHFVHNGSFYLWGIPEDGQIPLWHILELMPNNASFALASAAIKEQYQKRIKTIENVMDGTERPEYPETTLSEASSCHYQMYMQLGVIDPSVRTTALKDLEREWAAPQGISTIKAPHLNSTLFIYSPNCRLALGVNSSVGMKREKFYAKAVNYAGMAGTLAFVQVFLLVRQMEYTPTPSSVSKVSYWTIAIQVFIDSYLCMLHLTTGVLVDFLFIPFVAASFFSFVLVAIFGMRYMLVIWRIQRPERRGRRNRAAAAAAAAAAATTANNGNSAAVAGSTTAATDASTVAESSDTLEAEVSSRPRDTMPGGLPLPVTAARPVTVEEDSPRSDMQALYGRFCKLPLLNVIVRNVIRGSKRGLSLWFVLGMSTTRLALPVYFYACPENLMGHEPTRWIWGLVFWVTLQVCVLLLQDWLGPRFFIPKKYLPPIYDYHPILPPADEESGSRSGHGHHGPVQDCAICMLPIDTAPPMAGAARLSSVVGSLGRLNYMLTPCGHLFHSDCLERD